MKRLRITTLCLIVAAIAALVAAPFFIQPAHAQTNAFAVGTVLTNSMADANGRMIVPQTPYVLYSSAQLGQANFTIATTVTSPIPLAVNTMGVTKLTYMWKCDLGTEDVIINVYDETGTLVLNSYPLFTAVPANVWQQIFVASELAPNTTAGTQSTLLRLPQRAVSFSLKNNNAGTATCNAKLVVGY